MVDTKRTNEQFFTPHEVEARMMSYLPNLAGATVLEPSAGSGRLVRAALLAMAGRVDAVEIDPVLLESLRHEFRSRTVRVHAGDFMGWANPEQYDFVMMNPPFSRGTDMAHVRKAYGHLKPGGRLVSVMSTHWTFAATAAAQTFRDWKDSHGKPAVWEPLPEASFASSGTRVPTGLLVLDKPL